MIQEINNNNDASNNKFKKVNCNKKGSQKFRILFVKY